MSTEERFPRIVQDPDHVGGRPRIKGTRMPVAVIVELVAAGQTPAEILRDFDYLTVEDIREALRFAAELAAGRHPLPAG